MQFAQNRALKILQGIALASALFAVPTHASADEGFKKWIREFFPQAARAGITRQTYMAAFDGVNEPDPEVLRKAKYQPEFRSTIWDYLDSRVNPYTVQTGQEVAARHSNMLAAIEKHFGVSRWVLLAIWSMETNYGAVLDREDRLHYVPRALATLAYADSKRAKFARSQLVAALKILQAGDISRDQLTGSWAGAMGHTQFIPTSYHLYAIDADGNGKRDIWNSIPDALATAANLLNHHGHPLLALTIRRAVRKPPGLLEPGGGIDLFDGGDQLIQADGIVGMVIGQHECLV